MQDIKELNFNSLKDRLSVLGGKNYYAKEILDWIYQKGAVSFGEMTSLPKGFRSLLEKNFYIIGLKLKSKNGSSDGTTKFLFELKDKNLVEAVSIPSKKRLTGCISSQAGCKFCCNFCASGLKGFKRDLTKAEILDQVLLLKSARKERLSHIVFMGTGEPLDNYENVLEAVRIINHPFAFNIGARRITISTCGIIPGIKRLEKEKLQIELSVSLHAADNQTRSRIMPVNSKYPLDELIAACRQYASRTGRQVTFEYILINGVNSSLEDSKKLAGLLKNIKLAKVNLIPANPVPELKVFPPEPKQINLFKDGLLKSGLSVTLRKERGQDIAAACGQLRLKYEKT